MADEIIGTDIIIHQAESTGPLDPGEFRGPAGLVKLVSLGPAPIVDPTFTVEVSPSADDAMVSARWRGRDTYQGGLPGATAPAGTPMTFGGNDILRIESGHFIEY